MESCVFWAYNHPFLMLIPMIAIPITIVGITYLVSKLRRKNVWESCAIAGYLGAFLLMAEILVVAVLSYDYVKSFSNVVIASDRGEIIAVIGKARDFKASDPLLKNPIFEIEEVFVEADMKSDDNFTYDVTLIFGKDPKDIAKNCGPAGSIEVFKSEAESQLQSWLYEFNHRNSGKFSRFYNPEDLDQQQEFSNLVESYLEPLIKKWRGAGISSVHFTYSEGDPANF